MEGMTTEQLAGPYAGDCDGNSLSTRAKLRRESAFNCAIGMVPGRFVDIIEKSGIKFLR
jgi:hypothetical protein